jgi:hypothetical protein
VNRLHARRPQAGIAAGDIVAAVAAASDSPRGTELACFRSVPTVREVYMPSRRTLERAMKDRREGKSPGTQASEFVREEIHHIREGKHGARSTKQAIAIGLSKARRAGVRLPAPASRETPEATRQGAKRDLAAGRHPGGKISRKRSSAKAMEPGRRLRWRLRRDRRRAGGVRPRAWR